MNEIVLENKLVPVVVVHKVEEINPIVHALRAGGIRVVEITFRTECAYDALVKAIKDYPDMHIGAGTVLNKKQASAAIAAGAKFIVSPGLSKDIYEVCKAHNIDYIPGVVTPSEVMAALDLGLTYLKFFPANAFGGLKAIKAMSSPFPQVRWMPTGGVDNKNLKEFLAEKSIFAIGGSWLLKGDIAKNSQEAVKILKGE